MLRKANWDKTFQKSVKFSDCRKRISKTNLAKLWKNFPTSFCVCLVSWKQRNWEIRANIPKSCLRPVVSLLYATKSCRVNRPSLLRTRIGNLCQACAFASLPHFWQVVTWCKLHLARSRLRLRPQERLGLNSYLGLFALCQKKNWG